MWSGSLRVHEALSRSTTEYDPQQTLLKSDVSFQTVTTEKGKRDLIKLHLKAVKENKVGAGTTLEIFGNSTFLCPKKALDKYIKSKGGLGNLRKEKPFFLRSDGKCYTGKDFNTDLAKLTSTVTEGTGKVVRSHCFRAGVPSELCKLGATDEEISGTGRWTSTAYKGRQPIKSHFYPLNYTYLIFLFFSYYFLT